MSSDQMELLLAFEKAGSLEALSEVMGKDPSVISRRLKALADASPVLAKTGGRWQITPFGKQVNILNRHFLKESLALLSAKRAGEPKERIPSKSMLVVINAQKALQFPGRSSRSNLAAEDHILALLKLWRKRRWPIVHVKHISQAENSLFHRDSVGVQFLVGFEPAEGERVFEKQRASAFQKTRLENHIRRLKAPAIVLTGFTAGECIAATATQAYDLEIPTFVVVDATAAFEFKGNNGKIYKAERAHRETMRYLQAHFFAEVVETGFILDSGT